MLLTIKRAITRNFQNGVRPASFAFTTAQALASIFFITLLLWSGAANAQSATGGTVTDITVGGQKYRIHTFLSSGTFTVTEALPSVEYLIVGGGGAGGVEAGGGGAGGGVLAGTFTNLSTGALPVTVGNGGTGASPSNGQDSAFNGNVASGGGSGAGRAQGVGPGGGGTWRAPAGGPAVGTQIKQGGNGRSTTPFPAGGGGGAGTAGANGVIYSANPPRSGQSGAGGSGVSSSISGTPVFYGGGGGGASSIQGSAQGIGGIGGGGAGAPDIAGAKGGDGVANTGGGGGGGGNRTLLSVFGPPGDGGSGIVIIRYALPPEIETPTAVLSGPSGPQTGPFTVTVTFSEPLNGLDPSDFMITNGTASRLVMVSPTVFTILVTPTGLGEAVTVSLPVNTVTNSEGTGNAASNTLNVASSLLTDAQRDQIRSIIVDEAARDLRTQFRINQIANRAARDRFAASRRCRALEERTDLGEDALFELEAECRSEDVTRSMPLSFSGSLDANDGGTNLIGRLSSQSVGAYGQRRQIFLGDFNIVRENSGDTTATLNARYAWERPIAKDALLGLFVGANFSRSQIARSFKGTNLSYGASAGAYFVDELSENLFLDGFVSVGMGRNKLDIEDESVALGSVYSKSSVQLGLAVSGQREFDGFELRPELSLALGYSKIGEVMLDVATPAGTLSEALDAGNVTLGRLSFEPEFLIPIATNSTLYDDATFQIAPSLICEYLETTSVSQDCGGGLRLEWNANSKNGRNEFSVRIGRETIGASTRDSFGLHLRSAF